MAPPANIATLIVIAGFGIAAGVAVLYHYLTNPDSQEESYRYNNRNQSRPRQSRRPSPPPRQFSSSRERPTLRAISPDRETTSRQASTSSARVHRRLREILPCVICKQNMSNSTIELDCGHIFHDECYTIWRHVAVMQNPQVELCPSC